MPEQIPIERRHSLFFVLVVLLLVIGAGLFAYYLLVEKPQMQRLDSMNEMLTRLTGLQQSPVTNKLSDKFTDSDGDLVADAPSDASQQVDPPTLYFSYVAKEDPTRYKNAFADLIASITKATGKPVEYVPFETTQDQLSAMREGKLHITSLNTGSVPLGVCEAGFVPVAGLGDDKGSDKYQMEILARADTSIKSIPDLRNHILTLTDLNSNSGCKAPLVLIEGDFGLYPGHDFGIGYSGGHDESIKGLADGSYEAVAVANDVLKREISSGLIKPEQFRSIYKSADFPTASIGYVYNLKPELADKIRHAILDFNWKGTSMERGFQPSGQSQFVPVNYKNDWSLVRMIDDKFGDAYHIK
jgi:phosphonate transport system substrate-binding protein